MSPFFSFSLSNMRRIGFVCMLFQLLGAGQLSAQNLDSVSVKADTRDDLHPKLVSFIPAAAGVAYGFLALNITPLRKVDSYFHRRINRDNHSFYTTADDYLRYVPAAAVYGLDLLGIKGKNSFRDRTSIYLISSAFTGITVNVLKRNSNRLRPNRLNDYSFPSGHAATAFASAEFLRHEYGDESAWYAAAGYGIATTTAVLRLYKNYHWFSDLVAGAGIGILSTKFAYMVYPSVRKMVFGRSKSNTVVLPTYQNGGAALVISGKF